MRNKTHVSILIGLLVLAFFGAPLHAQHHGGQHPAEAQHSGGSVTPLHAPGNAIFGTVQEAIRALENDPTTDWSEVDVDALRRHLIDMHHVAMHVEIVQKRPIESGLEVHVRPTHDAARAALKRVLKAHPHMLKQETGWTMDVRRDGGVFVLRTTTDTPSDVPKIRALGYMGLLAYGGHHQRHHWHMVRGQHPHN
ncbi:hypothetical protein [Salisaeta longa]|uniref:hypothetical protein n=1 Tax=Salisaeta longa TaxID=503170 RepID=UPI0003B35A9B|nr:hypothetical protein [Salisaeta longa]